MRLFDLFLIKSINGGSAPQGQWQVKANYLDGTKIEYLSELEINTDSITANTYSSCVRLNKLILHHGVEIVGDGAFFACGSLTEVKFPKSVRYIGQTSFGNADSLVTIDFTDYTGNENILIMGTAFTRATIPSGFRILVKSQSAKDMLVAQDGLRNLASYFVIV